MFRRVVFALLIGSAPLPLAADWNLGFEGSSNRGYAFLTWAHPISLSAGEQLVPWGTVSWLYYTTVAAGGEAEVSAPGIGAGVMYRWQPSPRLALGIGPGYEYRWTRRQLPSGLELDEAGGGLALQTSLGYAMTDSTSLGLTGSWFGASEWIWVRGAVRQQITPSLRLGPEVGYQGNDDLTVTELGGIVEIPYGRNWLYARAGQATEEYRGGREEKRPYFSVGIGRSF